MILPQAPTPVNDEQNIIYEKSPNIKDISEFILKYINNKSFKILLSLNEEKQIINITAASNEEFSQIQYEKFISLDELITKNKLFKTFDNIEEAYTLIKELFQKEKISIKEYKENKTIKLEMKLLSLTGEEQLFDIDLYQKELSKDQIINQLISKINSLEKEIKEIKAENIKRDKEIESLKNNFNKYINSKNITPDNHISSNDESNYFKSSRIFTNEKKYQFLIDEFKKKFNITSDNKKVLKTKLIYRANKEDGFKASDFHSKCDNIKGTLIVVETDKGIKFGGFTMETWDGNNIAKKDNYAFCFSVSLRRIYKIIKNKEAIRCDPKIGPVFLNDIFGFRKENIKIGECYPIVHCNYTGCEDDYEINGCEISIIADEIEVYHIYTEYI